MQPGLFSGVCLKCRLNQRFNLAGRQGNVAPPALAQVVSEGSLRGQELLTNLRHVLLDFFLVLVNDVVFARGGLGQVLKVFFEKALRASRSEEVERLEDVALALQVIFVDVCHRAAVAFCTVATQVFELPAAEVTNATAVITAADALLGQDLSRRGL